MAYIEKIRVGTDIQKIPVSELPKFAEEIRRALIYQSSIRGTHLAPCLGVVELIMALYCVFDFAQDQLVFDVSHQSAVHKILSGRQEFFSNPELISCLSEFTNPSESPYDLFKVGHTSTAVSLGCGLVKAREMKGEAYAVVSVVGDGALSGGEALEGLNNAGALTSPFIIVVNDNEWSIGENQGGLYANLAELRRTKGKAVCNLFKSFGLEYVYVEEGHQIETLISAFQKAKKALRPIVVHVHTQKGKGYAPAEQNPELWHSMKKPFDMETGLPKNQGPSETYLDIIPNTLGEMIKNHPNMVVINAGTPSSIGMYQQKREQFGSRFIDVGIAEGHAMTMASAVAKTGCRPVVCVFSSFMQRAFDQMVQDIAMNKSPVVVLVFGGGISKNDATHQGTFDIPMVGAIPNVMYIHPTTVEETIDKIKWAVEQQEKSVFIRIPSQVYHTSEIKAQDNNDKENEVALIGLGEEYILAQEVAEKLREKGLHPAVINPGCSVPLDEKMVSDLANYRLVVSIENGSIQGGFGQSLAARLSLKGVCVMIYGAACEFNDRQTVVSQKEKYHLTPEQMSEDICRKLDGIST